MPRKNYFGGAVNPAQYQQLPASTISMPMSTPMSTPMNIPLVSTPTGTSFVSSARGRVSQFFKSKAVRMLNINLAILVFFGLVYTIWMWVSPDDWASPLGEGESFSVIDKLVNGFYLAVVAHTTVGFGDFYPNSVPAKITSMIHGIIVFYMNLYVGLS
jgi:hypothetical protein